MSNSYQNCLTVAIFSDGIIGIQFISILSEMHYWLLLFDCRGEPVLNVWGLGGHKMDVCVLRSPSEALIPRCISDNVNEIGPSNYRENEGNMQSVLLNNCQSISVAAPAVPSSCLSTRCQGYQ